MDSHPRRKDHFMQRASPQYNVVDPLFFNEDVFGVLDGSYILGTMDRDAVKAVRHEERKSFKHPVIGGLVSAAFVVVPLQSVLGDPLGLWWLTLASPFRLVGSFFLFLFGIILLWGVVRRRDEPWIVFVTKSGERAFPLRRDVSPKAAAVLRTLFGEGADAGIRRRCGKCRYDLTGNQTGRCPECGEEIPADMREWLAGCAKRTTTET